MRVFLVGYMGSGKTRTGRLLAKELDYAFRDMDEIFEERYRISIHDFYRKYGEDAFRKLEHQLLSETIHTDNVVFSMGGGTPCFFDNMDILNEYGLTIYIKMPAAALYRRLRESKKQRPVLHGIRTEELLEHIHQQLAIREPIYSRASAVVDGINLNINDLINLTRDYSSQG